MADSVNTQDAQDTQNTLKTSDTVDIIARIEKPVSLGRRMWNTISGAFLGGVATGATGAVVGAGIGAVTGYALSDQIKSGLLSANDHIAQDAGKDIVKNTVNTITSDPIQGTQAFTQMLTQLGDVAKHQQDAAAYINSMSPGGTAAYGAAAGAAVLGTAGAIAGAAKDGVVGFFTNRLVEERKVASLNADQLPPPS